MLLKWTPDLKRSVVCALVFIALSQLCRLCIINFEMVANDELQMLRKEAADLCLMVLSRMELWEQPLMSVRIAYHAAKVRTRLLPNMKQDFRCRNTHF